MQLYPKENDESTWRRLTVGKNALFFGQFFFKSTFGDYIYNNRFFFNSHLAHKYYER